MAAAAPVPRDPPGPPSSPSAWGLAIEGDWPRSAFAIGVLLNSAFVLVEAAFGLISGSMALVADAGHNLSDVLSLLIAWGAAYMATRPANSRYTYGYKSSSILAALANGAKG